MSYQVLARKFRPGRFDQLVGQDHVVRALTHALDNDRLHHAYLFTGTRGVGKTTIARILAKSLNCEQGVSSKPCGECSICLEVNENRFVDLIEVDAASRTRVDDTRDLLENAQYLPTRGRYKVYLIDEVHMLSASSFNALLKTLEEPPEHVKFLLATTDPKKVPVTVLSRCLQFQLKNISPERTAAYLSEILQEEGVSFETEALAEIGKAARGSMRDALSITDQAIGYGQGQLSLESVVEMLGLVGRDEIGALISALQTGDARQTLDVVAELADRSVDFEALLGELLGSLHDMAVSHAVGDGGQVGFDAETVQLLYQIALMGYRDLSIAPDPKSGIEMTLLRMLTFAPDEQGGRVPRLTETTPAVVDSAEPDTAEPLPAAEPAGEIQRNAAGKPRDSLPADSKWFDLVETLDLGGVARMIAEHSNLVESTGERIELLLDAAHDTLLSDALTGQIERALGKTLGRDIKLRITTGAVVAETPAARRQRLNEERQQKAERLLESDRNRTDFVKRVRRPVG